VKALLVVPRLPGTGHTGDRLRAELHVEALRAAGFEVVVVGGMPLGAASVMVPGAAAVVPVALPFLRIPLGLARALASGGPLQSGFFEGSWREAVAEAGAGADLAVMVLVRLWAQLKDALPSCPLVLDYVDALAEAARQAARSDPLLLRRLYWSLEAPRLAREEREAGARAAARVATTPFDASHLPEGTIAIANGVPIRPLASDATPRGAVVAFSGRLRYRPNRLASRRLLDSIWPRVRREVPEAVLRLGGADAPAEILRRSGRDGVEVISPVVDMPAFLRGALVVAAPVEMGTGTPNKVFEAFEAGAAVVASEAVAARAAAGGNGPPVSAGRSDVEIAARIVEYLRAPGRAAADGARGRKWVEAHADRREAVAALGAVYRRALAGGVR
jgi:glycosyltransferase involved in cell wall biosynthesis